MTDYFALLTEPRRPWLDPVALKEKFLALSATVHPDRVHSASAEEKAAANARFTALNAAYQCLRESKDRLRHLLELETGSKLGDLHDIPAELGNLFLDLARLKRDVDSLMAQRPTGQSPLLRVAWFQQAQGLIERLNATRLPLAQRLADLEYALRESNDEWDRTERDAAGRKKLLGRLTEIHRLTSFYSRWTAQLQEAAARLII